MITFSHLPSRLALLLNVENRLLLTPPPRLVPSGMKLMVMIWGLGQRPPVAVYRTTRDSNISSTGRALPRPRRHAVHDSRETIVEIHV